MPKQKKPLLRKKVSKKSKSDAVAKKLRGMIWDDVIRYKNVLGMNHYRANLSYAINDIDEKEGDVAATANVDKRYLSVNIRIYPILVKNWLEKKMDDEDVHEIIAHEMSHLATNDLYSLASSVYKTEEETKDAWESLTTVVGRLVHEVDKRRSGFIKKGGNCGKATKKYGFNK